MPIIEGSSGALIVGFGIYRVAGTPTTTLNGVAEKGALCIDTTNAFLYINTGTLAANTWTKVGLQV
jgi:hypothetical protein